MLCHALCVVQDRWLQLKGGDGMGEVRVRMAVVNGEDDSIAAGRMLALMERSLAFSGTPTLQVRQTFRHDCLLASAQVSVWGAACWAWRCWWARWERAQDLIMPPATDAPHPSHQQAIAHPVHQLCRASCTMAGRQVVLHPPVSDRFLVHAIDQLAWGEAVLDFRLGVPPWG